jgi:hypothetical protein
MTHKLIRTERIEWMAGTNLEKKNRRMPVQKRRGQCMLGMALPIQNKAQRMPGYNTHIKQNDMRITRQRNYKSLPNRNKFVSTVYDLFQKGIQRVAGETPNPRENDSAWPNRNDSPTYRRSDPVLRP